jgi:hypothetical protein
VKLTEQNPIAFLRFSELTYHAHLDYEKDSYISVQTSEFIKLSHAHARGMKIRKTSIIFVFWNGQVPLRLSFV